MNIFTNLLSEKIQPAPGYILVKTKEVEQKTSGGIYLAPSKEGDKKVRHGEVVSVGDKVVKGGVEVMPAVKSGTNILFKDGWNSEDLNLSDGKYQIISFEDLLAIIK